MILTEVFHVPGDVVLDVFDAADLEDHELVDGVANCQFSTRLNV